MSARFRLVQYTPDPFTGTKLTIGALVEAQGRVEFIRAQSAASPMMVGGNVSWTTLQMILDSFSRPTDFSVRSGEISPLAGVTEALAVPRDVSDPVDWVRANVLPRSHTEGAKSKGQRQKRATLGDGFFRQWRVNQFVRGKFTPERVPVRTPRALPQVRHNITHYVQGASELLLLEPVVGTRMSLQDDLKEISQSFLAWRALLGMAETTRDPSFIAYVMTGGYAGAMEEARAILQNAATEIVNVDEVAQRSGFLRRISEVGRSGTPQGDLGLH